MNSEVIRNILKDVDVPRFVRVRQHFDPSHIERKDIYTHIQTILRTPKMEKHIHKDMRIALTAGSREICNMNEILRSVVAVLHEMGAKPFIIPAMGSHGGATAEGQQQMLEGYGITEEYCGCPIVSSMETVKIGQTADGRDVFIDRNAAEADGILVIGRVKLHTDFRGRYESGIMKMMAIGLGKQKGASACHAQGFGKMAANVEAFGRTVLHNSRIAGAIAIVENAFDQTAALIGLGPDEIEDEEPKILDYARQRMPRILFPECDVLIVDEIGKNFSGTGMDPNISGRHATPYSSGGIQSQRVAVLGISEKTHSNGFGIGLADVTTYRVAEQLDREAMYVNSLTSRVLNLCSIPCTFENDRLAIQACIHTSVGIGPEGPRIVRIPNTLKLQEIMVSENYLDEISRMENDEIISEPFELPFDEDGFILK